MDVLCFLFLRVYFYRILNLEADILLINIRICFRLDSFCDETIKVWINGT